MWDTVAFLECGTVFTGHTDLVHSLDWRQDSSIITSGSQVTPAPLLHVADVCCLSALQALCMPTCYNQIFQFNITETPPKSLCLIHSHTRAYTVTYGHAKFVVKGT